MPSGGLSTAWTLGCSSPVRGYAVLIWSAVAVALFPSNSQADEPDGQRQREILHLLKHDCGSCHGMTLKGGLGPSLHPDVISEQDDDLLVETILNGRPGTPMAPWRISLNEAEARWLVTRLKEGIDDAQ